MEEHFNLMDCQLFLSLPKATGQYSSQRQPTACVAAKQTNGSETDHNEGHGEIIHCSECISLCNDWWDCVRDPIIICLSPHYVNITS